MQVVFCREPADLAAKCAAPNTEEGAEHMYALGRKRCKLQVARSRRHYLLVCGSDTFSAIPFEM